MPIMTDMVKYRRNGTFFWEDLNQRCSYLPDKTAATATSFYLTY